MKPGCQQALKHRVTQGVHIVNGDNVRYSISFRKLFSPAPEKSNILNLSPRTSSPVKDTIKTFENLINDSNSNSDNVLYGGLVESVTCREDISLIAGDSFTAKLDPKLLGRDKKKVFNISRGGNKINQVIQSLDDFYLQCSSEYNVDQLFICVGTNDIRNCKSNGVRHLRNPLVEMLNKAKYLFPSAKIFLQTLLPLPIADFNVHYVIRNVNEYNALIDELCRSEKVYILDVFRSFLEGGFRDPLLFNNDIRDCHPNRRGIGLLARFYIQKIRSTKFDPYSS